MGMSMKRVLTDSEKKEIYNDIRQYLADELEVDIDKIQDDTNIIDDLGADSILFLEMFEEFKSKLQIDLEVRTIGQYMLNHPVYTFKEIINAIYLFIEKGEELIEQETES
jgi:acyl carrier protein